MARVALGVAPGPGTERSSPVLILSWQCGQVCTGWMACPQGSWMSSTGGPWGVGAQASPQVVSAVMTGVRARPLSVSAYSWRGGCVVGSRRELLAAGRLHAELFRLQARAHA